MIIGAHAAPRELIGEHQAGRPGADDQNVHLHGDLQFP